MAAKRERINPGRGGARFVRRGERGEFKESESVGRSLKQDRPRKAKNEAKSGQGDRGDRKGGAKRSSRSTSTRSRSTSARKSSGRKGSTKRGGMRRGR